MDGSKPWYLSKILWMQIFGLIAVLVPASSAWISSHLSEAGGVFAAANFFLRLFSNSKLEIS